MHVHTCTHMHLHIHLHNTSSHTHAHTHMHIVVVLIGSTDCWHEYIGCEAIGKWRSEDIIVSFKCCSMYKCVGYKSLH